MTSKIRAYALLLCMSLLFPLPHALADARKAAPEETPPPAEESARLSAVPWTTRFTRLDSALAPAIGWNFVAGDFPQKLGYAGTRSFPRHVAIEEVDLNGDAWPDLVVREELGEKTFSYTFFAGCGNGWYSQVASMSEQHTGYTLHSPKTEPGTAPGGNSLAWKEIEVSPLKGAPRRYVFDQTGRDGSYVRAETPRLAALPWLRAGGTAVFFPGPDRLKGESAALNVSPGQWRSLSYPTAVNLADGGTADVQNIDLNGDGIPDMVVRQREGDAIQQIFFAGCGGGWYTPVLVTRAAEYSLGEAVIVDGLAWRTVTVPALFMDAKKGATETYAFTGRGYAPQAADQKTLRALAADPLVKKHGLVRISSDAQEQYLVIKGPDGTYRLSVLWGWEIPNLDPYGYEYRKTRGYEGIQADYSLRIPSSGTSDGMAFYELYRRRAKGLFVRVMKTYLPEGAMR